MHHHIKRLMLPLLVAALVLGSVSTSFARGMSRQGRTIRQGKSWGIGIGGANGGGNGISFKTFMGRRLALQAWAGVGIGQFGGTHVGVDALLEMPRLGGGRILDVAWNVGVGANTVLNNGTSFGVRGIIGLELLFKPLPIDLVFEWGPDLGLGKGRGLGFNRGGGHLRWWF